MYLLDRIMNRLEDSKFGQHDEIEISPSKNQLGAARSAWQSGQDNEYNISL